MIAPNLLNGVRVQRGGWQQPQQQPGWGVAQPGGGGGVMPAGPRYGGGFGGGQVGIGPMQPGGFDPRGGVGLGTQNPGILGSFDNLKKKHTIKKSGLYRLKAGEQVVPLSALARAK